MVTISPLHKARLAQRGFSLVELMVALTISLFLLLGVTYIYVGAKQVYRVQDNLGRMQEAGRLAFQYLSQDLRMAGFFGCASSGMALYHWSSPLPSPLPDACPTPDPTGTNQMFCIADGGACTNLDPLKAIEGHDFSGGAIWNPAPPSDISAKNGTDIIQIWGAGSMETAINGSTSGVDQLPIDKEGAASGIAAGDTLVAANCQNSLVFKVKDIPASNGITIEKSPGNNLCKNMQDNYQGGALLKLLHNIYYIKDDTVSNGSGGTETMPSLYRQIISGRNEKLVPYVEDMQLTYGWSDSPETYPVAYYTAAEMEDVTKGKGKWEQVKSIRVELLVRSADDNIATDVQPIYFNGSNVIPTDRRLRLVMRTTIGVRNRMLQSG